MVLAIACLLDVGCDGPILTDHPARLKMGFTERTRMGWIVAIGIFEKIFEHGFVMLHNVLIEGNRGPADP
jgi:hypothetical protein